MIDDSRTSNRITRSYKANKIDIRTLNPIESMMHRGIRYTSSIMRRRRSFSSSTVVDLRSDTVTMPTANMRAEALTAPLGDDVLGDDPTVQLLQQKAASMFGKEDALFVPSGTMSNLCAILSHAATVRSVGKEIIVGAGSHISMWEQGNVSTLGGVHSRQLPDHSSSRMSLEHIRSAYRSDNDDHYAKTCLVCLENSHNLNGGAVLDKAYIDAVGDLVHNGWEERVPLHIDGARIFNAAVSVGLPVDELCKAADSVSVCLSKGLGAPLGSVLVGSTDFIYQCKRARKALGGGMRQSGVVASMGLYALENHVERLQEDHKRAKWLAEELSSHDFHIAHQNQMIDSNIVFFCLPPSSASLSIQEFCNRLDNEFNVKIGGGYIRDGEKGPMIRAALHMGINDEGVERALEGMISVVK